MTKKKFFLIIFLLNLFSFPLVSSSEKNIDEKIDLFGEVLEKINKDFGTTILCNLHQVDLAKKYSDRVVGLLDGKIIFDEKSNQINKTDLEKIYI